MERLKIAQVVSTYPPYRGGMGKVAYEYTERLRARGHRVHVFAPAYRGADNDPKYVHRMKAPLQVGNASLVPSLVARLAGFDLVHLHYPFFGGAELVMLRKAVRKDQGLVMTYHMDAVAGGVRGTIFSMHRKMLFPAIAQRCERILVSTKDYANTSALMDTEGVMDKVEVHPFGIDQNRFSPGSSPFRAKFGITSNEIVFVFVGGLDKAHHFKGVPQILEALKQLPLTNWRCLIAGSGDMKETFEANVADSDIANKVHFLGNVSDEELPNVYRAGDIHLFPSTERAEAYGYVALEAAATGIPTIASDLPGVREVVLDGESGLLVAPRDVESLKEAMLTLMSQKELRERLGFSARKRIEAQFTWEPLISKLEDTYRDVMTHTHPKRI